MTRRVWPFKPLSPVIDAHSWKTQVIETLRAEQRIGLRDRPLRSFNYTFQLTDVQVGGLEALVRANRGADGYFVPDWTQALSVGTLTAGSNVSVPVSLENMIYGSDALVWSSDTAYEAVQLSQDSTGDIITQLDDTYANALLLPLWPGELSDAVEISHIGSRKARVSAAFDIEPGDYFGDSTYESYRSLDVVPVCPVLVGGLTSSYDYPVTVMASTAGEREYMRQREVSQVTYNVRWKLFAASDKRVLREWIASRFGRLKAFWLSTSNQDLEPAASVSGTTLNVFNDYLSRSAPYHIDIAMRDGTHYYREVTNVVATTPVDGRPTVNLTLDSSVTADLGQIVRVSFLRCARFDSDRAEYNYEAPHTLSLTMPCREVPEP